MGRKTIIQMALDQTALGECCVLNPYAGINKVKDPRRDTWGAFGHERNKTTSVGPSDLGSAQAYLRKGAELVARNQKWAGVCSCFACASASVINGLGQNYSIDLFSFGAAHNGHVFLVIDRPADSDENRPGTWGRQWGGIKPALVVDMWYAIQMGHPRDAVFAHNSQYMVWLTSKPMVKQMLRVAV